MNMKNDLTPELSRRKQRHDRKKAMSVIEGAITQGDARGVPVQADATAFAKDSNIRNFDALRVPREKKNHWATLLRDQDKLSAPTRPLRRTTGVKVSSEWTNFTGCPQCSDNEKCRAIEYAAIIVGKDEPTVTLAGVFHWFQIGNARSIIVDLQYSKVCANVTHLVSGAVSAHALIRQITAYSAPVVASIVVLEYPANNYTEALVNKHKVFSAATAHAVPLDNSITASPPCGLESLGPSTQKWWINRLASILSSGDNDTSVIIGSKQLVTGADSVIGISVLLKENDVVSCGHFEPLTERTIAAAKFDHTLSGFVKMTQYGTSNWASGIPTEIYCFFYNPNDTDTGDEKTELEWQFVIQDGISCSNAPVYDPFNLNDSSCSRGASLLCPVGDAYRKSTPLVLNTRQHLIVDNLPLSGPYSILKTSLRIRKKDVNKITTECAPLLLYSEKAVLDNMFRTARTVCSGPEERKESLTLAYEIAVSNGY
ncbi:hypothetical protein RB195_024794 [Necator americanus]|uniref:Uncharacterized protein n=1 Tax=Necator americanus TaxID=51031 RepID=A0ABR1EPN3_NECAM